MKLYEKSPVKRDFLGEISKKLSIKVDIKGNLYEENVDADYVVSSRFNLRLFFDKVMTNPYVSNSFPSAVTNGGFSVRFTLAQ